MTRTSLRAPRRFVAISPSWAPCNRRLRMQRRSRSAGKALPTRSQARGFRYTRWEVFGPRISRRPSITAPTASRCGAGRGSASFVAAAPMENAPRCGAFSRSLSRLPAGPTARETTLYSSGCAVYYNIPQRLRNRARHRRDLRALRLWLLGKRRFVVVPLDGGNAIRLVRPRAEVNELATFRAERTPLRVGRPFDSLAAGRAGNGARCVHELGRCSVSMRPRGRGSAPLRHSAPVPLTLLLGTTGAMVTALASERERGEAGGPSWTTGEIVTDYRTLVLIERQINDYYYNLT